MIGSSTETIDAVTVATQRLCAAHNMLVAMGSFLATWKPCDPSLTCVCCGRLGARCLHFVFVERMAELSLLCCNECERLLMEAS